MRNSRHQLQTMSDNSSVVLLFPPGMSLLQFGNKVYPRKFLFQGFWRFRWVLLYGAGPPFLLHFRKMQMRKAMGGVAWYAVEQWKPICSFASCFCTEICIEWNRDFHLQNWMPTYSNSKRSVWNCATNEKIFRKGMFSTCDICQLIRGTCKVSNIGLSTYFILEIYSCQLDFVQYFHLRLSLPSWLSSSSTRPSLGAVGKFVMTFHSPE